MIMQRGAGRFGQKHLVHVPLRSINYSVKNKMGQRLVGPKTISAKNKMGQKLVGPKTSWAKKHIG